jgi:hypothetical protein
MWVEGVKRGDWGFAVIFMYLWLLFYCNDRMAPRIECVMMVNHDECCDGFESVINDE